jgi:hypothetical protein
VQIPTRDNKPVLPPSSFVVGTLLLTMISTLLFAVGVEFRFYHACVRAEFFARPESVWEKVDPKRPVATRAGPDSRVATVGRPSKMSSPLRQDSKLLMRYLLGTAPANC